MPSFVPNDPETLEDQRRYTRARLTEVACLECLSTVGVKKNSEHHTSIQWSRTALAGCQEFARMGSTSDGRQVHASCSRLVASIEAAVSEGEIPIGAEDGY